MRRVIGGLLVAVCALALTAGDASAKQQKTGHPLKAAATKTAVKSTAAKSTAAKPTIRKASLRKAPGRKAAVAVAAGGAAVGHRLRCVGAVEGALAAVARHRRIGYFVAHADATRESCHGFPASRPLNP